ncbi:MAG: nitroreductase family deazaflavin-dependent oxidoreductase [Spongiibacteraceae bacterium]
MNDKNIPNALPDWIQAHIKLYQEDGNAGHYWDSTAAGGTGKITTLLLTTKGRKSGNTLTIPLIYRPTNTGGYCVIASKGGAASHPAWYLNLMADPTVQIQVATDKYTATAHIAEGEEREKLWQTLVDYYPPYTDYQTATQRQIPVVVLDPVKER